MAEIFPDNMDFSAYLEETDAQTKVRPASAWLEALKARLRSKRNERRVFLPWPKVNENFEFRPGEVTLWAGQNGHGKSLVVSEVTLSLMGQGERVCMASFEMKPETTLQRMARMFCGLNPFSPEFQGDDGIAELEKLYDEFVGWTDKRLWLYDQMGTADRDQVIGMTRYCAKELGINHIVIDNLAKCVPDEDDFNGQKRFIASMNAIALDYACHVHVVHHLKKPSKETETPDKHDTKGSGAITDQVDNMFLVFRNKGKEDDIKAKGKDSVRRNEADQFVLCRKQRNYEGSADGEPSIQLWFHRDAQQFVAEAGDEPLFFPNYPHRKTPGF